MLVAGSYRWLQETPPSAAPAVWTAQNSRQSFLWLGSLVQSPQWDPAGGTFAAVAAANIQLHQNFTRAEFVLSSIPSEPTPEKKCFHHHRGLNPACINYRLMCRQSANSFLMNAFETCDFSCWLHIHEAKLIENVPEDVCVQILILRNSQLDFSQNGFPLWPREGSGSWQSFNHGNMTSATHRWSDEIRWDRKQQKMKWAWWISPVWCPSQTLRTCLWCPWSPRRTEHSGTGSTTSRKHSPANQPVNKLTRLH